MSQTASREPVLGLLQDFAKQSGCEAYRTESKKVDLILTYLWLRQLTEDLSFETFLEKFAKLADYDEINRKHPEDALRHHCPRTQKRAEELGAAQWSARECCEILSVYVDMVREAERQGVEVPMTLDEYLEMDGPNYKAGNVEVEKPMRSTRRKRAQSDDAAAPSTVEPVQSVPASATVLPTSVTPGDKNVADHVTGIVAGPKPRKPDSVGQRIIYQMPAGRQIIGTVTGMTTRDDRNYVSFMTDEGEQFTAVNREHCVLVDGDAPPAPANISERRVIQIPKAHYPHLVQVLAMEEPIGNVPIGALITAYHTEFECGYLCSVEVFNGETGPYVEASLRTADGDIIDACPPRMNILGDYRFNGCGNGTLLVTIRTRG